MNATPLVKFAVSAEPFVKIVVVNFAKGAVISLLTNIVVGQTMKIINKKIK